MRAQENQPLKTFAGVLIFRQKFPKTLAKGLTLYA
ncbi:hypothetical protein Nhal_0791 [Nitrosococcus halophilus Nc 4]|uniref:Uncharacterized protein n=1 Tax=Nitrosococcus halophilus (strain Nc4) TaxID=472759 RepID=D5BXL3_NITHN|nr:hypothetical protein Nhal_0791 [Nitrosococcus halophilus Nc 4]